MLLVKNTPMISFTFSAKGSLHTIVGFLHHKYLINKFIFNNVYLFLLFFERLLLYRKYISCEK